MVGEGAWFISSKFNLLFDYNLILFPAHVLGHVVLSNQEKLVRLVSVCYWGDIIITGVKNTRTQHTLTICSHSNVHVSVYLRNLTYWLNPMLFVYSFIKFCLVWHIGLWLLILPCLHSWENAEHIPCRQIRFPSPFTHTLSTLEMTLNCIW